MSIVLAQAEELPQLLRLYSACVQKMRRQGIDQWDEKYPNAEVLGKDIQSRSLYVLENSPAHQGEARYVAAVAINEEQHPAYGALHWAGGEPALVVHRFCVDPGCQRMGLASRLMQFAEETARQRGCASIRLDTHSGNPPALRLYQRLGYRKVGEVYFRGKATPFVCFEKTIPSVTRRPKRR